MNARGYVAMRSAMSRAGEAGEAGETEEADAPGEKLDLGADAFRGCFGCGDENALGLRMRFERIGEVVVSRTELMPEHAGYPAFAHGGVVATLLDEAMGWAMFHLAGRHGVTRSLSVTYRRPVALGRRLVVRGRVLRVDGGVARLQSSIEDVRGRLLASGEGEWVIVRGERASARREYED